MADPVDLEITAGLPFSKTFAVTLTEGRSYWNEVNQFEVLAQVRKKKERTSDLVLDLAGFISVTKVNANLFVFELKMSGLQTRSLSAPGFYDILMSDPGTTDNRAYIISHGKVRRDTVITAETAGAE